MGLRPVSLPVGEMMGAPTVLWEILTVGSIELLPKRLCHWSLERLVLEEIPVDSLGGPCAVLLNMLQGDSSLETKRSSPTRKAVGGVVLV